MIEVKGQIEAVRRQVGRRAIEAGEARTVTVSQTYDATVDDLWDALTSAERIPRWFLPVSGDLRLGGRYQLVGNAGGTVESCDAPNSYGVTWEYGGGVTWVTVRLTEVEPGRTRVELQHVAPSADLGAEMWEQFGPSATGIGWDQTLLGLAQHLSTGEVRPDNAQEWLVSDEGISFMRGSADRWASAHVAFGADADVARAAADTTFAAYTGAAPASMD